MKTIEIEGVEYKVTVLKGQKGPKKSMFGVKSRAAKRRNDSYSECHLISM